MGSSLGRNTNTELGGWKHLQDRLLQHYQSQRCLSYLTGLYGCQWGRYQRARTPAGTFCCSKVECSSLLVLVITFLLSLVLLYFWSNAQNDYNNFNWNFYNGKWIPWSIVVLVVVAAIFTYISVLLVLAICLLAESQRLYLHWSHKIGIFLVLIFCAISIGVLLNQWAKEWTTFRLSFQVTAPYLHIGGAAAMTLLSWMVSQHFARINKPGLRAALLVPYLAPLLLLYLLPLSLYSPCIKHPGTLAPKPAVYGHRGASMIAPENTRMSFEKSIEVGTEGLETDVAISYDGIPFLMHDETLRRTTNIREVLPNSSANSADSFKWATLASLNAGKWFLKDNPFQTAHQLSKEARVWAANQSVYTLAELLRLAARHKQLVMFDLKKPYKSHPYSNTWINIVLNVIKQSGIDQRQILWLPDELRDSVQFLAPRFVQVFGGKKKIEVLQRNNITVVNLHYTQLSSQEIRYYAAANITTILYPVNEPWLYSLVWCMGAHSVTSDAPHILKKIQRPDFLMTPSQFTTMWLTTDMVSCLFITLIFVFNWWRENGFPCCPHQRELKEKRDYSVFQTELHNRSSPEQPPHPV